MLPAPPTLPFPDLSTLVVPAARGDTARLEARIGAFYRAIATVMGRDALPAVTQVRLHPADADTLRAWWALAIGRHGSPRYRAQTLGWIWLQWGPVEDAQVVRGTIEVRPTP